MPGAARAWASIFRLKLLFCCLRRIRRKTPALNRAARQTSHQNRLCFVLEENRAPAQFQTRFFRSGQWRAGERRAPAVISLIPIHLPSHSSHSFRSTPRPFRAAPAYSSPGPLRLPKPRRRRLSPPFPPLRPLGATKKPAGGACGLFSSFRAAA